MTKPVDQHAGFDPVVNYYSDCTGSLALTLWSIATADDQQLLHGVINYVRWHEGFSPEVLGINDGMRQHDEHHLMMVRKTLDYLRTGVLMCSQPDCEFDSCIRRRYLSSMAENALSHQAH